MYRIDILLEKNYADYEKFIRSLEAGLLFYSVKYKNFLEKLLTCKSEYWVVHDNWNIKGVLPLMFKDGKYGTVVNSLPFYGSNGGFLTWDEEATKMLNEKYAELLSSDKIAASNFVTNPLLSCEIIPNHTLTEERIGQFTSMNFKIDIEGNLMNSFHYKVRNTIRKALREVDRIAIDNTCFDFLRDTHIENMIFIGGKPKSDRFFSLISECFLAGTDYNIYVAYNKENIPMSALLLFYYNNVTEYYTPVIKNKFRNLQPLSALIFRAMADAAAKGYKKWNWGATWKSQTSVYLFKSRWNTQDIFYKYYCKINNEKIYFSSPAELSSEYSDFFVIPFNKLQS